MIINFIDLFCGAGGLSSGLTKAGLNCLVGIDFLQPAVDTFNANHRDSIGICLDLREAQTKSIKKLIRNRRVHLICGGPPCQGFSMIGKNDSNDSRNHLFMEYLKFVEDFNPNYILIENVTGLLALKNIDTLKSIFDCFDKLGYHLDVRVLSAHHFGVPQARRRVIIIGNNLQIENRYPDKKFNNPGEEKDVYEPARTVDWAFKNLVKHNGSQHNHELKTALIKNQLKRDRISHVPEGKSVRYERDEKKYLPKELWFGCNWEEIDEKRFREAKLKRLDRSKPSPTISTDGKKYYHPTEDRYLTVREAAAIQSFPQDFNFSGSLKKQWTQIGNAVPPLMAEALGKSIQAMHKNMKKKVEHNTYRDFELLRNIAFKYSEETSYDNPKLTQTSFNF